MGRLTIVFAALLVMLTQAGCNTLQGIGRDVEKAGEAIQGAAKR